MTIDFYTWTTPNGRKVSIFLEEAALPYTVHPIDIGKGAQHEPGFLAVSPNNKIPAITDPDGPGGAPISLFESGAILIYLAEKTGLFLPSGGAARAKTLQWLMFQMGGIGPMFGQAFHFRNAAPQKIDYAINRYTRESERLLGVMEGAVADAAFVAGDYSIADMATYPWVKPVMAGGTDYAERFPAVAAWVTRVGERAGVQRGMAIPNL